VLTDTELNDGARRMQAAFSRDGTSEVVTMLEQMATEPVRHG
jgi:hypothetical protein